MSTQANSHAGRSRRTGRRIALAVAATGVAGAALALPAGTAVAMPTDYVKEVKVGNGDTLVLDGNTTTVGVEDPEHGVAGVMYREKPGPVQSQMDPNGTYTLTFPKPAAQADATPKIIYKHDGKKVKTINFPQAPDHRG
ncbi:hypothetical protein [Streptomyces spirodelae]|uniref:Uncharacterized protein n=1 Tax=Streptomyces spirodelae TaxID=2812904 RepID=A0ABS3WQ69_9ACTN|nr:hypothetical protein [Streptomyces spirodelae]MBO8185263.1 hypothetical protein [Streptomyces spirodelae]